VGRQHQTFCAPGEKEAPLEIPASPWHVGRCVYIPFEHWEVILDFARKQDPERTELLERWSTTDPLKSYDLHPPATVLDALIHFVEELARQIERAPPLVPEPTEEIPEDLVNEEHARMLQAVNAVLGESRRLGQPYMVWVS